MPSSENDGGSSESSSSSSNKQDQIISRGKGSSSASSSVGVGWNPEQGEDDGISSGSDDHHGRAQMPYPPEQDAFQSRKRKRSQSNASSSVGWNPDGSDGDGASDSDSEEGQVNSQTDLPSQIDIAIAKNDDDIPDETEAPAEALPSSESHTKPPERIRYEMLGAPTLLYRHAPSYLDPSNRPSTLTPQQLSMALYMNEYPIKDWFTNREKNGGLRKVHSSSTRSAFLNSTHVPQPARPWGRPHAWDWRHTIHDNTSKRCKTLEDLRHQAELDANDLVEDLHCANRAKARWFWRDIKQRNRDELQVSNVATQPNEGHQRKLTGFNVFCSDYINELKQSIALDSGASSGPRHHFELACKAWNELTKEEQSEYDRKAKRLNSKVESQTKDKKPRGIRKTALEKKRRSREQKQKYRKEKSTDMHNSDRMNGDVESQTTDVKQQSKKPLGLRKTVMEKQKRSGQPKRTAKGRTTGFNIFRSEYMRTNALAADATGADRKAHLLVCSKGAGTEWKEMTEDEKSVYTEKAARENESRAMQSVGESDDSEVDDDEEHNIGKHAKKRRKTSRFQMFVSEYVHRWKQSNPNASAAERKSAMIKCSKEASAKWKELTEEEKSAYDEKARAKDDDNSASHLESTSKQRKNKGKTTGFNIFRTESWNNLKKLSPIHDGASAADKREYVKRHRKEISANWKEMSEDAKQRYRQDAERRNELSLASNPSGLDDDLDTKRSNDSVGSRMDSTVEDDNSYDNFFKKGSENQEHLIGVEEQRYGSYPYAILNGVSGDMDSTDIQLLHDNYLASSRQRLESCPCYFAPFRRPDTSFGFHLNDSVPGSNDKDKLVIQQSEDGCDDEQSKVRVETEDIKDEEGGLMDESTKVDDVQGNGSGAATKIRDKTISESGCENRNGVGGPSGHGNCLIAVPCQCQYCKEHEPFWFLVHPTGENLSCVSMSKISFPRSPRDSSLNGNGKGQVVDVGGRILQISQCGAAASHLLSTNHMLSLVARTSQYCSVLYAKAVNAAPLEEKKCSIEFHIQEESRIDLRAPYGSLQPSYLPVHAACDPKTTVSFFTRPSFAILSCDYSGACTTIHQVAMREEPDVKTHSLGSTLADISFIEYCTNNRMALWAAARSRVIPKLSTGFFEARNGTVTGYGHSIFRIDLRNDSSSFLWSPSHSEYMTEGFHSINGMMTDSTSEHLLWVTSSSACKVWALDVRYKSAKIVVSWSLPSLCNDFGSQMAVTGTHGGGILMSQPHSCVSTPTQNVQPPIMFSIKKDPNSYTLDVHQFPSAMPRFRTKSLESAGFQEVQEHKYDVTSVARSSILPLPDISGGVFNIGLATLICSTKTCLSERELGHLGYQTHGSIMYVISLTSLGDMHCHSLLQNDAGKETQTKQFHGLPVGTKAIPVPREVGVTSANQLQMSISLCNEFPITSSAITPYAVLNAGDCCSFRSFDIDAILNDVPPCKVDNEDVNVDACGDQAASTKFPQSAHDLDMCKATKGAALNLSSYEKVETFRVASCGAEVNEEKASVHHSLPRFRALLSPAMPNSFSRAQEGLVSASTTRSPPQPMTLPSTHMVVVKNKDNDDTMNCDTDKSCNAPEKRVQDIGRDIINRLNSNYFNEKGGGQTGVKNESNSDSE